MNRLGRQFGIVAITVGTILATHVVPAQAAGAFSRLQVLVPGETAAPGSPTGKTGTPLAQTAGVPFTITVRACDSQWNTVTTVTDAIQILSTDNSATLPPTAQLQNGTGTYTVTFNAGSPGFTIYAHDLTDGTIPDGASALVRSLVLQGFQFSSITQKNQYAGQSQTVTLTARDPNGNIVTAYSGSVRLKEITSYGDGRISPDSVTLSSGSWTGPVTCYRADETSINRGNVNLYAFLTVAPAKNGTSDPFTVHPGNFARVQVIVPGESPLPGSVSGRTGSASDQSAGKSFVVGIYSTDNWWNPVFSGDNVRLTSSDAAANTPLSGALSNGFRQFTVSLGTVGSQTLTISDQSNGSILSMTSSPIVVVPSNIDHFAVNAISSPQTAGVPVTVTIRGVDATGNTVPNYNADALLIPNTGSGSMTPQSITFTSGVWTGPATFKGAGGAVSFGVTDFSAPPHTGQSNSFSVQPGPFAGLQVLLPGESPQGGTAIGKTGVPTTQQAGTPFTLTVRAVDAYWNLVPTNADTVALGSTDAFAGMPAETTLAGGQRLFPVTLYRTTGPQRIWASDVSQPSARPDTSSDVTVTGGPFARVLVLAPGEQAAPGTTTGRTGTATDQSINYSFTCTVLATDQWWNPVTGPTDVVRLTSDDPGATLPPDQALVNGRADMNMKLARGGYDQILVSDVTRPSITGSSTQVRAISSGFHLEATVSPGSARAGEPFTLTVRVTNDAGSTIQEINSFITVEVQNANNRTPGRGTLLSTQFQLLQGQRSVSETYTFAEPIVIVAHDDAGNAPGISGVIDITPGQATVIKMSSDPSWVTGNKHATIHGSVQDDFGNGVPGQPIQFQRISGTGTLTPVDTATAANGDAIADFLSPRTPEMDVIRATSGSLTADLNVETALVDPNAPGGTITNYPNPFHPPMQPTTIAYKLGDNASVTVRIFSQSGVLVRRQTFARGDVGGRVGLNTWDWDGRNGNGDVVASGGYIAFVEAEGNGATLHVMRRKIAVVR